MITRVNGAYASESVSQPPAEGKRQWLSARTTPVALVCGLILALSGCSSSTSSGTVQASTAAPRITKAEMGTGVTDKYEVVDPTTEFAPDTPKIFCVWKAEGLGVGAAVRGVWIAEDVGKAAPANSKIDEATIHLPFANQGSLTLSKPDKGFPVGKYRVEIYVGSDLLKSTPFTVVSE